MFILMLKHTLHHSVATIQILLLIFFSSCNPAQPSQPYEFFGISMTMEYRILIGDNITSSDDKLMIERIIIATFSEINETYNKWNPQSELSRLNRLKAGEIHPISPKMSQFLSETSKVVTLSEGQFDPTIEPLQKIWKEKLASGVLPKDEEIAKILPAIGWNNIHFNQKTFCKDHDATALDLGGIAKGYCIDLLTERLQKAGFINLFIEWGGEIRTSGQHPSGRPWRIFISRLGDKDSAHAIDELDLINQAIATSGDYLQYWDVLEKGEKVRYTHIFDPHTYHPILVKETSIASVSVLAPNCALADALATAAMLFPSVKEAEEWSTKVRKTYPETAFWITARKTEVQIAPKK